MFVRKELNYTLDTLHSRLRWKYKGTMHYKFTEMSPFFQRWVQRSILSFEVVITLFSFLYECQVYITFHFPFCLPKPFNFPSSLHKYLINNYDVLSYSKHGLCTYRTGIIWELIRKILGPHLESGSLGDWAPNICFNQLSRWFLYILKFEKHQLKFDWLHFTWDTF